MKPTIRLGRIKKKPVTQASIRSSRTRNASDIKWAALAAPGGAPTTSHQFEKFRREAAYVWAAVNCAHNGAIRPPVSFINRGQPPERSSVYRVSKPVRCQRLLAVGYTGSAQNVADI